MNAATDQPDDGDPIDVVALLSQQHLQLESLFDELLDCNEVAGRRSLLERVGDDLAVHIVAEEQVGYPAVRAVRTEDILLESLEEHLSLKRLLADLLQLPADDDSYMAKYKVLQEQTEHHHREEEEHLFPKVALLLDGAQRQQLGARVRQHEQRSRAAGSPRYRLGEQTDSAAPMN